MSMFDAPIPGQSLTSEPRGAPYERPPEITDMTEALDYHLNNLDNPKAVKEAMFFLEMGMDLSSLVEGITRGAVLEGIHSIDVSLGIQPVIHEYIKGYADALEIDYEEGFGMDKEEEEQIEYGKNLLLAKKMLAESKGKDFDYDEEAGLSKQEGMNFFGPDGRIRDDYIPKPEPKGRVINPDMPVEEDTIKEASAKKPKGLMART